MGLPNHVSSIYIYILYYIIFLILFSHITLLNINLRLGPIALQRLGTIRVHMIDGHVSIRVRVFQLLDFTKLTNVCSKFVTFYNLSFMNKKYMNIHFSTIFDENHPSLYHCLFASIINIFKKSKGSFDNKP